MRPYRPPDRVLICSVCATITLTLLYIASGWISASVVCLSVEINIDQGQVFVLSPPLQSTGAIYLGSVAIQVPRWHSNVHWDCDFSSSPAFVDVSFPFWPFIIIACGAIGAIRWRRRFINGSVSICQYCGYDLRGNPSAPCPECGSRRTECSEGSR